MALLRYPIRQYAYVVNDIDAACRHWYELTGAGPWHISRHHKSVGESYRGTPIEPDLSYAFGQAGPAHIQLIQQHDDTPTCYNEMFKPGEEGFHHFALLVPDFEAEKKRFEDRGFESVMELVSAARVAYMDTRSALGCFVELYESTTNIAETFDGWAAEAEAWDGKTDPFREM